MGYSTDFEGALNIFPLIKPEHKAYINKFSGTRRVKRKEFLTVSRSDPVRLAVDLPVGEEGCYFVGAEGYAGQEWDANDVVDHSTPPKGQPGLWCQWMVNNDHLEWDGSEKFQSYVEWLEYLIDHFFNPWGYVLNGEIRWQGEDSDDRGVIYVQDNVVEAVSDIVINPGPSWSRT